MSLISIRRYLSSFKVKLFLWFWFITLTSIIVSRFITHQLLNDDNISIVAEQVNKEDLHFLNRIKAKLTQNSFAQIQNNYKRKKHRRTDLTLWTQLPSDRLNVEKLSPQRSHFNDIIKKHIQTRENDTTQSVIYSHTRITGPIPVIYQNQQTLLFVSKKMPRKTLQHFLKEMPLWLRLTIPLTISFALCWVLARSLSKPVLKMKEATLQIAQGDLSTRVTGLNTRQDELGGLARCFNQMADKLETNISAQQRLLGDVSHELRSPLTRLQMALALAQQKGEDQEQYFERCQKEINQLDEMIAHVLTLSRLENSFKPLNIASFSFTRLLKSIVSDQQLLAENKQVLIECNAHKDITIQGDSHLLSGAITNVLINAIKHTAKNSTIKIALIDNNHQLSLTISDSGNGVPEDALAKIFTAFYRVNSARDRETGGTGLGLAIAKQAITAHHGKIFAKNINQTNEHHQGLAVTIELPKNQVNQ